MIWKAWRNESVALVGFLVALAGLFSAHLAILVAGLFLLGLSVLAQQLAQRTLKGLTVTTRLAERFAEIDEVVATEMIVKNPLPWPVLDVQWKMDLPQQLIPSGTGTRLAQAGGVRQTLSGRLWVGGRQRVRIQLQLTGQARGRWNVGPGSLVFKDPLSWNELIREDDSLYHLTVWPRRFSLPQTFWASNPLMGPVKGKPWNPPDPLRVTGVRRYQPGDPVRQVAPYASARMAQLMVKQLEPVQDRAVAVLLHPKTTAVHWHGINRALLEDAISLAATVVESSIQAGFATGLSSSGSLPGHIRGFSFPSLMRQDAGELLTALAWTQPNGTMDDDLPHVLARLQRQLLPGTVLVVVSPYWHESLTQSLEPPVRRGLRVIFLTLGSHEVAVPAWVRERWRYNDGRWSRV